MAVIIDQKNQALDHPCLPNANRMLVSQGGTRAVTSAFLQDMDRREQQMLQQELQSLSSWTLTAIHGHRQVTDNDITTSRGAYSFGTGVAFGVAVGALTGGIGGVVAGWLWTGHELETAKQELQKRWEVEEQVECRRLTELVIRTAFNRACRLADKLDAIELECARRNRENGVHAQHYSITNRAEGVMQRNLNVWQCLTPTAPPQLQQPITDNSRAIGELATSRELSASTFANNCSEIQQLQDAHHALKEVHDNFLNLYRQVAGYQSGMNWLIGQWKFAVEFLGQQGCTQTGRPNPDQLRIRLLGKR